MIDTVIDFESYYDNVINVKKLGNYNYAELSHSYMVSIVNDEIQDVGTIAEMGNKYGRLFTDPNIQPWAANSNFDRTWFDKEYGFTANPWRCVLDVAACRQMPRTLAGAVKMVLGIKMDKTTRAEMQGVIYDTLDDKQKKKVLKYCLDDSIEALRLIRKLTPLTPVEEAVAMQTRQMSYRGIRVNYEQVDADKTRLHYLRHQAFKTIPWTVTDKPCSPIALAHYCKQFGIETPNSLAKDDEDFVFWADDMAKRYPQVSIAIKAMATWRRTNMLLKKCDALLARLRSDGRLPLELKYCGAPHTRRWSSVGFNIQNLDRTPVLVDELGAMFPHECVRDEKTGAMVHPGVWTRRWIIPDEGCIFGILDFCQIEPRCLAVETGNEALLQLVRQGFGMYEAYARNSLDWTGGNLKKENPKRYSSCKAQVIGLGYGCGHKKYRGVARKMANHIITPDQAKIDVHEFRGGNPLITNFWKVNNSMLESAHAQGGDTSLHIEMPTGELLSHYDITYRTAYDDESGKPKRSFASYKARGDVSAITYNVWGGVVVENRIQRYARDILADALVRCGQVGFQIGFHAHDEIIFQFDRSSAKADLEEAGKIMTTNPAWCPEVPIEIEGGLHEHYVK